MNLNNNERNGFFIAGIVLFAVAIIGTFVIPYFFLIMPIVVLIAILLIWISKRKTLTKILWTVSPLGLLVLLFVINYQLNKMESETYLVPKEFRGNFAVYFEESCGVDAEYEKGRRIYRVPDDGMLITKFEREFGIIDNEFYLIDTEGNKLILKEIKLFYRH